MKNLKNKIADILMVRGEGFLADDGVDERVCRKVADEIVEVLTANPPRVLVTVRGGVVQSIHADAAVLALVKDFDNIQAGDDFNPRSFSRPEIASAKSFAEELIADLPVPQKSEAGLYTFQLTLKGWHRRLKRRGEADNLLRWVNAPSREALERWMKRRKIQLDGPAQSCIDIIGPFDLPGGVDFVLDEDGNVIQSASLKGGAP